MRVLRSVGNMYPRFYGGLSGVVEVPPCHVFRSVDFKRTAFMRLDFCVACGHRDDLNHHHLVPRVHDGSDDENCHKHRTSPLLAGLEQAERPSTVVPHTRPMAAFRRSLVRVLAGRPQRGHQHWETHRRSFLSHGGPTRLFGQPLAALTAAPSRASARYRPLSSGCGLVGAVRHRSASGGGTVFHKAGRRFED
jgi:hypothetical protein